MDGLRDETGEINGLDCSGGVNVYPILVLGIRIFGRHFLSGGQIRLTLLGMLIMEALDTLTIIIRWGIRLVQWTLVSFECIFVHFFDVDSSGHHHRGFGWDGFWYRDGESFYFLFEKGLICCGRGGKSQGWEKYM